MAIRPSGWNTEILRTEALRCLWQGRSWLVGGVLLQFCIALYYIFLSPFSLGREYADLVLCGQLLALLGVLLSIAWLCAGWLAPQRPPDPARDSLPIPPAQRRLMDWLPLLAVPAALSVSAVLVWGCLQLYFGVPFGSGSELDGDWLISDGPEGWRTVPNPWWPRVLAGGMCILAAGLLPASIGVMLREGLRHAVLRTVVLLLATAGFVWVMLGWGREFTSMCYRQTRGHGILPYALIGIILLLLPPLLGMLGRSARRWLLLGIVFLAMAIAALPFMEGLPLVGKLPQQLRPLLGDGRFALAWYIGHLDFALDIGWLLERWTSNLLLGSPERPLRIPMWVGAALLPFIYAAWIPAGYLLGMSLGRQRADTD